MAPPKKNASLVTVTALVPIEHDGQSYAPTEPVDMTQAQADALVGRGAAEIVAAAETADPAGK